MRKITKQRKKWLDRRARRILEELGEPSKRSRRADDPDADLASVKGIIEIEAPPVLNLEDDLADTVDFVAEVRRLAYGKRKTVRMCFAQTKEVSPPAALYLVAEAYRGRHIASGKHYITGRYPPDPAVERAMQEMGFFELVDVTNRPLAPSKTPTHAYIKFISGVIAEGERVDTLTKLLQEKVATVLPTATPALYRAITEAMTNVTQHAYMKECGRSKIPTLKNRWWMLGRVEGNSLTVLFADQGWGIPRTLKHTSTGRRVLDLLRPLGLLNLNDGALIHQSIEHRRSRSGEEHRGRGLNDLLQFIERCKDGSLRILSGAGVYSWSYDQPPTYGKLARDIGGTLIEWTVPIDRLT